MSSKQNVADKAVSFVSKHWVFFLGAAVIIIAWKPLKNIVQGLLAPLEGAAAILSTPKKIIEALDKDMTGDLQKNLYKLVLDMVRQTSYDASMLKDFNALPLTSSQKSYLLKVWKLPKPIPVPTSNFWDVVDKKTMFWSALDSVLTKNYDASQLSNFQKLPFTDEQKNYLMQVWKQPK